MGMERHEVPTVFVHGHAAPSDVGYVEDRLCAALHDTVVRYSVLWIDTVGGAAVERATARIGETFEALEARGVAERVQIDLGLLRAREGLVFDSDSPGYLFVRAAGAQGLRFTVRGLEAHAGMAPERGLSAIRIAAAALAIVPLAWFMGLATEEIGKHAGPGVGGLLNAAFGNATELIIALFALSEGLVDVVKASLTGSILGNLLLVLGLSMLAGGLRHKSQSFSREASGIHTTMLLVAVIGSRPADLRSWRA